jgi:hypothetical protein
MDYTAAMYVKGIEPFTTQRPHLYETVVLPSIVTGGYLFLNFSGAVKYLFRYSKYYMKLVRQVEKLLNLLFF